jgi:hypothetical protein
LEVSSRRIVLFYQRVIGMAKRDKRVETVPQTVPDTVQPPRRVIKAGAVAVASWNRMRDQAIAEAEQARREAEVAEAQATERGLIAVERAAKRQGVQVERDSPRGPIIASRDGLLWLVRKGKVLPVHERAGLRFRQDYERAASDGLGSSLGRDAGGGYGPKSGTTEEQLRARQAVKDALASLSSPMLKPYIEEVAGKGEMLSGPAFGGDARRVGDHLLPCVIALDALARHYGMLR